MKQIHEPVSHGLPRLLRVALVSLDLPAVGVPLRLIRTLPGVFGFLP